MTTTVHAFDDDALGDLDGVGIAAALRAGEVGASDVLEAAIARVERVEPHLSALVARTYAAARDAAGRTLGSGPFAGVPVVVKDNTDVAGTPTRYGSRAIDDRPIAHDSAPTRQLRATGVTVLGKSTMPEFGLTSTTEFSWRAPTRNPWNTSFSAGGSSGGSAALVAAGAVPFAHGNDGGGSIRIPAAACGLVGLKSTRGRLLDRTFARQLPIPLVVEGVVTRSVRDSAHHLAATEAVYRNPRLPMVGLVERPSRRRRRIGVVTTTVVGEVDPGRVRVAREAADIFAAAGHDVREIPLPVGEQFAEDFTLYWGLMAQVLTAGTKIERRGGFDPARCEPVTRGLIDLWRSRARATPGAVRRLRAARALATTMFESLDAVLSPTLAQPTPEIGYLGSDVPFDELFARMTRQVGFTPLDNVTGTPAISLPAGLDERGLPTSIHLSAAVGDERTLLELAYEFEEAVPFPRIRHLPTLPPPALDDE